MIEKYCIPVPQQDDSSERFQDPVETCEHAWELRAMRCANGAIQYRPQCVLCGTGKPAVAHARLTAAQRAQAAPFDSELERTVRRAAWEQWRDTAQGNYQERWWAWYNQYTTSDVWARRREAVLKRDNYVCRACGVNHAAIAHHLTYEHVGAEPLFDLVAVCAPCHEQIHGRGTP